MTLQIFQVCRSSSNWWTSWHRWRETRTRLNSRTPYLSQKRLFMTKVTKEMSSIRLKKLILWKPAVLKLWCSICQQIRQS